MRATLVLVLGAALAGCEGNINNNDLTLPITSRVSIDSSAIQSNGFSDTPSISADGRFVVFRSAASNLVSNDTTGYNDIFLRDTVTGQTMRLTSLMDIAGVDTDFSGAEQGVFLSITPVNLSADDNSFDPTISGDGRRAAFATFATNLSNPADERIYSDIYSTNMLGGFTRISKPYNTTTVNGHSSKPTMSFDGQMIAFQSDANNLVAGDAGFTDVFLWSASILKLMSRGATPSNGNSSNAMISADGRYIVFQSVATNLTTDTDGNGASDIYRVDTAGGTIELVSFDVTGTQAANGASTDASVSADGRYVVFASMASDLVAPGIDNNAASDIYIRDMTLGVTTRVSVSLAGGDPDGACTKPSVSGDGQFVAFESPSTNLIGLDTNNMTDVFIRNLATGETQRASVKTFGGEVNGTSSSPRLSLDGNYIVLGSLATTLVEKDTNALADVFLRGPLK